MKSRTNEICVIGNDKLSRYTNPDYRADNCITIALSRLTVLRYRWAWRVLFPVLFKILRPTFSAFFSLLMTKADSNFPRSIEGGRWLLVLFLKIISCQHFFLSWITVTGYSSGVSREKYPLNLVLRFRCTKCSANVCTQRFWPTRTEWLNCIWNW